jgi:hypothetical protein
MSNSVHSHPLTSIEKSNLPAERKTAIREYWDGLHHRMGTIAAIGAGTSVGAATVREGGMLVRSEAVSAITGLALALIDHTVGGLDIKGVPLDGILAGGGVLGALAAPHLGISELAPEFRTIAATSTGIMFYRKGKEHFSKKGVPSLHGRSLKELAEDLGV